MIWTRLLVHTIACWVWIQHGSPWSFHIKKPPYVIVTASPRSSDPFYIVTYYIKWVTTSWTYSKYIDTNLFSNFKLHTTVCPGSSDQFYIVTSYIKWVTTYWTYSSYPIYVVFLLYDKNI